MTRTSATQSSDYRRKHDLQALMSGYNWPDRFGKWLSNWSRLTLAAPIRTLSLFSGAGGLDVGFREAGFHALEMVDLDSRFVSTLDANSGPGRLFGDVAVKCMDVRRYGRSIPAGVDFVIGGPPCQSFSAAGRRAGGVAGVADDRGQLFKAYVKLLKLIRPRGFLFENVPGITGANGGNDWKIVCRAFESAGYKVYFRVLDAADYGVPQHRERMFIVGVRVGEYSFPRPTHGPSSPLELPYFTAQAALSGLAVEGESVAVALNGQYGHLLSDIPPGLNYSFYTERMGHDRPVFAWRSKFSDFLYKADPNRPIRTLKARGGKYTGPFHWTNRHFTVDELKRLQTFPDDYQITGSRAVAVQQLGNSVPPQQARMLAISILQQVFRYEVPFLLPLLETSDDLNLGRRKRENTSYYTLLASHKITKVKPTTTAGEGWTENVSVSDDLQLKPVRCSAAGIQLHFRPGKDSWTFCTGIPTLNLCDYSLRISMQPSKGNLWVLPCASVELRLASLRMDHFVAAWRAFERELQRQGLKADLVQLSGYYQYASAFTTNMQFGKRHDWRWNSLATLCEGNFCGMTMLKREFTKNLGIPPNKRVQFERFLKQLGIDVRTHATNSQIPPGKVLVPYSFPTRAKRNVW